MSEVRKLRSLRSSPIAGAAIAALVMVVAFVLADAIPAAQAQTYSVIYNFTGGQDGARPWAGVTRDIGGNLYGTASTGGGANNDGTVYKLTHKNDHWLFSLLYIFQGGNDGAGPDARVVFGPDGSLYGTTTGGGSNNNCPTGCGTVFNLKPTPTRPPTALTPWVETVLYRFQGSPGDGAVPDYGDLVFHDGAMYNTTGTGGAYLNCGNGGCGVVYQLTPSGHSWTESVIYNFTGVYDGGIPHGGVAFDKGGNLYTTASQYGTYGSGAVIELTPAGSGWGETTIYDFCLVPCSDGFSPYSGVILDGARNLYGTTTGGGFNNGGTVFELTPTGGSWMFNVLYPFNGSGQTGPVANLVMDAAGNLYGTTYQQGANNFGSVFELSPAGGGNYTYTDLHDFCLDPYVCSDGKYPAGVLTLSGGNLYGTATEGGAYGAGVVFEITLN